ncbi:MAG: FAD:protein FMN transferase, partial [Clostridia bacterium]|nr:FAD:protein FMN transferase [Clostridia bacterium]
FSSSIPFSAQILHANGKAIYNEMVQAMESVGASVNANSGNSALSNFNESNSTDWVEVDKHFYTLATYAKQVYELTDGAFNCAVTPASSEWCVDALGIASYGYGQGQPNALPTLERLEQLKAVTDLSLLSTKTEGEKYFVKKSVSGLQLDFGGIAKGYCADLCTEIAHRYGVKSALIDIAGNLVLVGKYYKDRTEKSWGIGVVNPRRSGNGSSRYVCGFTTNGGVSVVTAGDYERYYDYAYSQSDSVKVCHIINGNTLIPITLSATIDKYQTNATAVCSATVIGASSMECDALSTAICVVGIERGKQLLIDKGLSGLIFTADKKMSNGGEIEFVASRTLYQTEYERL